jgi:hypothetical protein
MQYSLWGRLLIVSGVIFMSLGGHFIGSNLEYQWLLRWCFWLPGIAALVFGLRFFATGIKEEIAADIQRGTTDKVPTGPG